VTPSHNPPEDGGFKYNPPNGGPADTDVTRWIQDEANRILAGSGADGLDGVPRVPFERARSASVPHDFTGDYVADLEHVVDLAAIAASGLRIGVDAAGGRRGGVLGRDRGAVRPGPHRHQPVGGPDVRVHDPRLGREGSAWTLVAVRDGGLVALRDRFDLSLGNDADADRHGVVVPGTGLMNPNHVLAAAISCGCSAGDERGGPTSPWARRSSRRRSSTGSSPTSAGGWSRSPSASSGSWTASWTGRSGSAARRARGRRSSPRWHGVDDRQGRHHRLPAGAEVTARLGRNPAEVYAELTTRFGSPAYRRIDAPADARAQGGAGRAGARGVTATTLGGDPIVARLTRAPGKRRPDRRAQGRDRPGLVRGRPSGTENVTKLYAESFPRRGPPGARAGRGPGDRRRGG